MNVPFAFDSMLVFAWLSFFFLVGIYLRARVGFIQKFLFPSCLVGGFAGLILMQTRLIDVETSALENFGYHFFNISFISVGLTRSEDANVPTSKFHGMKGPAWMALIQGLTFPMQAVIGGLVVLVFGALGMELFSTFGFLVPLGFNEGPGQALSIGKAWEAVGFANGATIGLTFAAVGYFFSFFVGVPLVNYGMRKGWAFHGQENLTRDCITGVYSKDAECESAGKLTIHSGNAETLAFQAALIGIVYGVTYAIIGVLGSFLPPDVGIILWGFFFFMGLGVALGLKKAMDLLGLGHLPDPGVQRRITGWSVDFLIVATVMAIQLKVVWEYILPIGVISLAVGVCTTLLVIWFGRRLPQYSLERTAAIFGTVTGTVSCGLLLLRIVDPEFRTPVAYEIAVMNAFALPIVGGGAVLVNAPLWWGWSVGLTVLVFVGIMAVSLVMLKMLGLVGKKAA
ncbi:MAG: hypothetical protein JEZ02_07425 [Desulfatibacillum sp.]|nr:hypothetical protein [Desulfatibacillum sp.]